MSTYYLEMTSKNELLKKCCSDREFSIAEMEIKQWDVNKFLYGFIGKGYGGHLLSDCIEQAWLWGAKRVWVHTCDLDHSSALKNYQARGLRLYKTIPENV